MSQLDTQQRGPSIRLLLALLGTQVIGSYAFGQTNVDLRRLPTIDNYGQAAGLSPQPATQFQTTGQPVTETEILSEPIADLAVTTEPSPWWSPVSWIRPVEWDSGVELGISGTAGNSESLSLRAGAKMKRKTKLHEISWDLTYAKTNSDGVETQNFGVLNAGYERFLGETPWTYFAKYRMTYDEFRAFDLRLLANGGVGYQLIKTDSLKWKTRLGAGASHEVGGPDDRWVPEAVLGSDLDWQLSERQKVTSKFDYFPAWEDFGDYRTYHDLAWEILLNETYGLNLKLSLIHQYDSTPNGSNPNDVNYALLLLWNM